MVESKNNEKENPLMFYAIIIIALGVVGYKWYQEHNLQLIILNNIPYIILILLIILIFIGVLFGSTSVNNNTYLDIAKIIFHSIAFMILGLFIYRIIIQNYEFLFIPHIILSIIIFAYYNYIFHKSIFHVKEYELEHQEKIKKQREEIRKILKKHPHTSEETKKVLEELRQIVATFDQEAIQEFYLLSEISSLKSKISEQEREEEQLREYHKKEQLKTEIEEMEERKRELQQTQEDKNRKVIDDMETYNNTVFRKADLNYEQIILLREQDYNPANEYDLLERKIIPVFIEKTMNHSRTHTFLVWSTKRLLEKRFKVESLEYHDTKDADITFKHKNKYYAIEIETGTLLQKNRQLAEKIKFLNRKYPCRWIFLVSNRNLLTQYKKYGITCQRNTTEKTLKKLLAIQ